MKIRLFEPTDADYAAIVKVHNLFCPQQPVGVDLVKQVDAQRKTDYFWERYVAEVDGQMVATGAISHTPWSFRPKKYFIDWDCHPDWIDSADIAFFTDMYNRLLARDPEKVLVYICEDHTNRVEHLTQLGFTQSHIDAYSELKVNDFNFEAYVALPAHLASMGVKILTLSELKDVGKDGWIARLESAEWESLQDVPAEEPLIRKSVDEWWQEMQNPRRPHDGYFIAINDAGDFVGTTNLKTGAEGVYYVGFTGVKRSWRRKGIATALKVRAIDYAKRTGAHAIQTDNEENNPMYDLNMQLGFKPLPRWSDYIKEFA